MLGRSGPDIALDVWVMKSQEAAFQFWHPMLCLLSLCDPDAKGRVWATPPKMLGSSPQHGLRLFEEGHHLVDEADDEVRDIVDLLECNYVPVPV